MTCNICHRIPESSCGDLTCKWHLQEHAPGCSIGDRLQMMRPCHPKEFETDTHCSYCSHKLPLKRKFVFFGEMQPDHSRASPFDVYACSARCEVALSDELDCQDADYLRKVEKWWMLAPTMPQTQFIKECKQRGVKP